MDKKTPSEKVRKLIADYAAKISSSWCRSVEEILKAGAYAAEAVKKAPEGRKLLLEKLKMQESTFSKLVQIGDNRQLPKIIKHLPPSFSTIYLISQLPQEQLDEGVETGMINTEATREEIKKLKAGEEAKGGKGPKKPHNVPAEAPESTIQEELQEDDDDDLDFDDDDTEAAESDSSEEDTTIYDELLEEWKEKGLRRSRWIATPTPARQRFIDDVLLPAPFKPAA
jgi:hypothetical protein